MYIPGWKITHNEIFSDINNNPIYGLYNDHKTALVKTITYNVINFLNDIEAYPEYYNYDGTILNFNNLSLDKLIDINNNILNIINKYNKNSEIIKYCMIENYDIQNE